MSRLSFASTLIAAAALLPMSLPTFAAPRETDAVFLAELKLRVCDADYAATGSTIRASLVPYGSADTTLDYPRNDFERGSEFTYVLSLDGIKTFADITTLQITNWGSDQVCFDRIQLIVNRSPIFEWQGQYIRFENNFLAISHAELRAHPLWVNWRQEFGGYFDEALLKRIVAAGVATGMDETSQGDYSYSWYGTNNPVITPRDKESFNVRIELEFRHRCTTISGTSTWCRLFLLSGDFILGVTCVARASGEGGGAWGYIEATGTPLTSPMSGLTSSLSRYVYAHQWAAYTQGNMVRIVETTAKAFGRQPNCKVFDL